MACRAELPALGSPPGWGLREGTHRSTVQRLALRVLGLEGAVFLSFARPAALRCPHPCCTLFLPQPTSSVPVSSGWRHRGGHRGFTHPHLIKMVPGSKDPQGLRDPGLIWTHNLHLPHLTINFMPQTHSACPVLSDLLRGGSGPGLQPGSGSESGPSHDQSVPRGRAECVTRARTQSVTRVRAQSGSRLP